ncbi:P-loop NTPase fold protein [Angustibacter sp. McL0619]|uniref:P-loop NTPase fold protein n=1 Tax=Angustibacter sp. McL0619 TaxID=3415676 RepID=UPI003CF888E5
MLERLDIPEDFGLKVSAAVAMRYLTDRITIGERMLGDASTMPPDEFRRLAQRWHDENLAVIDSIIVDRDGAQRPNFGGDDSTPRDAVREHQILLDDVSRELGRLSQLRLRISIPLDEEGSHEPAFGSSSVELPGFEMTLEKSVSESPASESPVSESPTSEEPRRAKAKFERVPGYRPPTEDSAVLGEEPEVAQEPSLAELPDSPAEPATPAEPDGTEADDTAAAPPDVQDRFVYADAATAVLPAYDADAGHPVDLIGVDDVVDAFAYLITSRGMQPPLAVGLFGNWGSGKTFFLRSLQRRIDELTRGARQSARPQHEIGVFKRVVQIEFNAWHYVEGNLWASLVDHIFANLRTSASEKESELDRRRRAVTAQLASTRTEHQSLSSQINRLQGRRDEEADRARQLTEVQAKKLQKVSRIQLSDVAAAAMLDISETSAVTGALKPVGVRPDQVAGQAVSTSAADAARSLADARDVVHRGSALFGPMRQYGWWWVLFLVVAAGVAPLVAVGLQHVHASAVTQVLTAVAGFFSAAAVVVNGGTRWATGSLNRIEGAQRQVQARVDAESRRQADDLARIQQEIDGLDREIQEALRRQNEADTEIRALTDQLAELTPGRLLAGFLQERSDSADYRKFLGVTSLIRRDFEKLSELVAANNETILSDDAAADESSGADFNRVVLYVDDLDRCPPSRVVEVLQAVHLLMSFPVFVVVVAVDPRWLAQSLESQYRDLLGGGPSSSHGEQDGSATPQDYLEKIFQIPFSIGPLDLATRARFVEGLLGPEVVPAQLSLVDPPPSDPTSTSTLNPETILAEPNPAASATDDGLDLSGLDLDTFLTEPAPDTAKELPEPPSIAVDLNPENLRFSEAELAFLQELLPLLDTSPRSLKRYVNVYRLIKSVGRIGPSSQPGRADAPEPYQQAMFLLATQTGLPSQGAALLGAILDFDPNTDPLSHSASLLDVLERYMDIEEEVGRPDTSDDWTRLRGWLKTHEPIAFCPAASLVPYVRHVRLYAFA